MAHFLFRLDLEAFFASGKDFFFFWSYGTSLFKLDLEAFFASGKSFYRTQNDSNQVAFEFQNLFETSKHRQ